MSNLDNKEAMQALDPDGMYGAIAGFPEQIRKAIEVGEELSIEPSRFDGIKNIIVCGMGGSAIGGDLVRSIFGYWGKEKLRLMSMFG